MRVFVIACAAAAFGQVAVARDIALTLDWPDTAPSAELVAVARDSAGSVLETVRQPVAATTRNAVLSLPSLSRQASTVQVGVLVDGVITLQSARALVDGGQPPDRLTLSAALTASFTVDYLCDSGRVLSVTETPTQLTLDSLDTSLLLEQTDLAGRFQAADGTLANRIPGLIQLEGPAGALLESCQPIPTRPILPLTALGEGNGWQVQTGLDGSVVSFAGTPQADAATPPARLATNIARLDQNTLKLALEPYVLTLRNSPCRLARNDMPFPYQASLVGPDVTEISGCAGDPLIALEGHVWQVTHLFGHDLLPFDESASFTLQFDAGRLSGRTSCNRYLGRAIVDNAQLVLSDLGTTRLPCPANLHALETRFLDAMEAATGFVRLPDGGLALYAGSTAVLIASR